MSGSPPVRHIILGTAGHIDHGKTRLVGQLTGINTDRLPEEKARGISIDLGFAHWEQDGFHFGVIDVPGHERFVRNMVAGATGINLAVLVIAADDSVMPQTREHLEIMDLLGVRTGLVAVTKIDLVERGYLELVQAEVEELVAGTFLEGCPVVFVSSETGEGLDELKATIGRLAAAGDWPESLPLFRLPVDRVFSVSGHGTVATGSALSGEVHAGDVLELLPAQREVRVRSVQSHGVQAADSGARRRTAVNLAGLKADEVHRGMELATPGYLKPTRRLIVQLRALGSSPLVLKDRLVLNLHLGTGEVPARLIFKGRQLQPGERGIAELRTKEPIVATHGQPFILRRISPGLTVAGGSVLDPQVPPTRRIKDIVEYGESLNGRPEADRLSFLARQRDILAHDPLEAAARAGVRPDRYPALVEQLSASGELIRIGGGDRPLLVHRQRLAALSRSVLRAIRAEIARQQPRRALPKPVLLAACRGITHPDLLEAVFRNLLKSKELVEVGPNVGPADVQVKLTKNQEQARSKMLQEISSAKLTPPTTKELAAATGQKLDQILPLLNLCVEDGLLVRVADDLYFTPDAIEQARVGTKAWLDEHGVATMSQLREALGLSRKFSIPLFEYLDAVGITVRAGDQRHAGPAIEISLTAAPFS